MLGTDETPPKSYTSFKGQQKIASGLLPAVALAAKRAMELDLYEPVLIFDDTTGRSIDLDLRGSNEEIMLRHGDLSMAISSQEQIAESPNDQPRGVGRPKLGVVAREVTLLPHHWEWLAAQPGGASAALRRLIVEAKRANVEKDGLRMAQERAYHFMSAMGGDLPGYEEAIRALFANDRIKFEGLIESWPNDIRVHATELAFGHGD